ncbi:MAG: thermonuclease family protein [Candidatus Methanofastidiosa archaeon]|nr:thermonuclease family protein [Candidatus Methanofastidiosa archaeon]
MKHSILITALLIGMVLACSGCVLGDGQSDTATVTNVVDGDTCDVRLSSGEEIRVRLIGIDTPEIYGENLEYEWEGIEKYKLDDWGYAAKRLLEQLVLGEKVSLEGDEYCDETDIYGRYLYYLVLEGTNLSMELVEAGMARAYTSFECKYEKELLLLEEEAKINNVGIWSDDFQRQSDKVYIAYINFDAMGDDNLLLDDEYVVIKNGSADQEDMEGWRLRDYSGKSLTLHDIILQPSEELIIFSGCGRGIGVHWCSDGAIWNNNGDVAFLYDENGILVDKYEYTS